MLRALIIDDSPVFLNSMRALLGLFTGIELVGMAGNGEDGLRLATELAPDLVFVDLHMPGLGGLQVTEQLRQHASQVRVVLISWHDDPEYRARAAAVGAERFVCKDNLLTKLPAIISGPPSLLPGLGVKP